MSETLSVRGVVVWASSGAWCWFTASVLVTLVAVLVVVQMVLTSMGPARLKGLQKPYCGSLGRKAACAARLEWWLLVGVALRAAMSLGADLQRQNLALQQLLERRRSWWTRVVSFVRHLQVPGPQQTIQGVLVNMVHTFTLYQRWWHHLYLRVQLHSLGLPAGGYLHLLGPPLLPLVFVGTYAAATHVTGALLATSAAVATGDNKDATGDNKDATGNNKDATGNNKVATGNNKDAPGDTKKVRVATLMKTGKTEMCDDCKKCRHPSLVTIRPPNAEWNCAPLLYITGAGALGILPFPFGCIGCLCLGLGAYQDCRVMAIAYAREEYFKERCSICGHPHNWYEKFF
ncbi:uncharacterized protein [Procambarus clarkii]|uniref:uncharacterized protein n=1 Tax=Procambarus clarkii TaxID=6728 RepID=UPI0037439219